MSLLQHLFGLGVLEGPIAEKEFTGFKIQLWAKRGHRDKFDPTRHGKFARMAAEKAIEMPVGSIPNPCLVPLDGDDSETGGYVFAHITLTERPIDGDQHAT